MPRPLRAAAVKAASRIRGVYEWEDCAETSERFQLIAGAIEDNFEREEQEDNASEDYLDSAESDASEDEESEEEGSYESSFVSKSDDDSDRDDEEEYVVPRYAGPAEAAREDVPAPSVPGDAERELSPTVVDETAHYTYAIYPDRPGPSMAGYLVDTPYADGPPELGHTDEPSELGYADPSELGYAIDPPWTPGAASPPCTSWTPGYYACASPRSPSPCNCDAVRSPTPHPRAARSPLSPSPQPCKRPRTSEWASGQSLGADWPEEPQA